MVIKKKVLQYFFIAIIYLFPPHILFCQEIKNHFKLDTLINLNLETNNNININQNLLLSGNSNLILVHYYSRIKTDSFLFCVINKNGFKVKNFRAVSSELKNEIYSSEPSAISVNKDFIVLSYFKKIAFFRFVLNNNKEIENILFHKIFNVPETFKFLEFRNDTDLLCGRIYNRSRKNSKENTIIQRYTVSNDSIKLHVTFNPEFENVEFSHFSPNHWISSNNKLIVVSQTTEYKLSFFDYSGNFLFNHIDTKPNWVKLNEERIKKIRSSVPINYAALLIDSLREVNDKLISRIEGVWFLNNDSLVVRYYIFDCISNMRIRYFDVFKLYNSKLELIYSDLQDGKFPLAINEIVSKSNYDILSWNYMNYIGRNQILMLKNYAPINYLNRSWLEIKKEEENYYKENDPIPSLLIFNYNK
jgi:hypothetical protein